MNAARTDNAPRSAPGPRLSRSRRARRGAALGMTLVVLMVVALVGMAIYSLSMAASGLANKGYLKTQASALAEAGVQDLYSRLGVAEETATAGAFGLPSAISSTSVDSPASTLDGTYSARVANTPAPVTSGGTTTYTVVLEGTGTSRDGVTQSVERAVVTVSNNANSPYAFPDEAIVANGYVGLSGGSKTVDAAGNHGAGASANGKITESGGSQIDGPLASGDVAHSSTPGQTVTVLPAPIAFPSASVVSQWTSAWATAAQAATATYPTGHVLSSYSLSGASGTLTAPAYISGNLNLSGTSALTINADPSVSGPAVLYVGGTITASGGSSITNNGVEIVSVGKVNLSGGSAGAYTVTNTATSGLLSLSNDNSQAINLSGGSNATIGFVYAVNGGATLSGGSTITGSLISGGASGGVTFSGGSTKLVYPTGLNGFSGFPGGTYSAGTITQWSRVQ